MKIRVFASAAAVMALLSGMTIVVPAGAATLTVDENECTTVADPDATSGVNGTSRWSLGDDGTLTIDAGTLTDRCGFGLNAVTGSVTVAGEKTKKVVLNEGVKAASDSTQLFSGFSALTGIDGLENLDTSAATDMSFMFEGDSSLPSLDLSHFDTSNVNNMAGMFHDDSSLSSLDISSFDTSNVTTMYAMFYGDSSLSSLDVSRFDTSDNANMSYMFAGDSSLSSLDVSRFDTSNVTDMSYMFAGDSGLREVRFGVDFKFVTSAIGDAKFPEAGTDSGRYTGKWINVGSGTVDDPKGSNVWTAEQLMGTYDGSKHADWYVWQPIPVVSPGVTVKYVDEQGKSVHADQSIMGNVGDVYDTSTSVYKLDITGYTLDASKLPTNAKGALGDKAITVTYVYRKVPAPSPAPDNNGGGSATNVNSGDAGDGSLATTGTNIMLTSLGGVLLLAAGLALLWRRCHAE